MSAFHRISVIICQLLYGLAASSPSTTPPLLSERFSSLGLKVGRLSFVPHCGARGQLGQGTSYILHGTSHYCSTSAWKWPDLPGGNNRCLDLYQKESLRLPMGCES